jgi:hypothetical protein
MKRLIVIASIAASAIVGGAAFKALAASSGPTTPPWVNPMTGVVVEGAVPALVPVVNESGSVVGYVGKDALFGDPDVSSAPAPVVNDSGASIGCLDDAYSSSAC